MFSKLKNGNFFKSLSGILCSIELIELRDKTSVTHQHFYFQSLSQREMDAKPFIIHESGGDAGK